MANKNDQQNEHQEGRLTKEPYATRAKEVQETRKGKPTKPKSAEEIDETEAFKEEIAEYGIPRELSEELYSHAKNTINFRDDLKGKIYFFGDIAVLTFESFEEDPEKTRRD